jgi:hypothetical protein
LGKLYRSGRRPFTTWTVERVFLLYLRFKELKNNLTLISGSPHVLLKDFVYEIRNLTEGTAAIGPGTTRQRVTVSGHREYSLHRDPADG